MNSCLQLVLSLPYLPFISKKLLNRNLMWYTCDYRKQLTPFLWYRTFSSKQPIDHVQKLASYHSKIVSTYLQTSTHQLFISTLSCQVAPTFSIGTGVGLLRSVCILSQLWFDLMYSTPISNWPWCHLIIKLRSVCFWVTQFSPHQFSYDREVIQSHSSYWKYIIR